MFDKIGLKCITFNCAQSCIFVRVEIHRNSTLEMWNNPCEFKQPKLTTTARSGFIIAPVIPMTKFFILYYTSGGTSTNKPWHFRLLGNEKLTCFHNVGNNNWLKDEHSIIFTEIGHSANWFFNNWKERKKKYKTRFNSNTACHTCIDRCIVTLKWST